MKCPQCQRNQRRGKEGMTCKSCSYQFHFDPKADSFSLTQKLHDDLFGKIIANASASGSYHFTRNQLFSSARHFVKRGGIGIAIVLTIVLVLTYFTFSTGFGPGMFIGGFISLILLIALIGRVSGNYGISRSKWDAFVKRWLSSGREIPGLIQSPALESPPPQWAENDIHDYGVSGIILCNRPELVDWLVLNHFHSQNNKLILTPSGYPTYLAPIAQKLLAETPDLPVFLLHDPNTTRDAMLRNCVFPVRNVTDLGADAASMANLPVIQSRFPKYAPADIPLDCIPYKTFSAAVGHCLITGTVLADTSATWSLESDTDVSFG